MLKKRRLTGAVTAFAVAVGLFLFGVVDAVPVQAAAPATLFGTSASAVSSGLRYCLSRAGLAVQELCQWPSQWSALLQRHPEHRHTHRISVVRLHSDSHRDLLGRITIRMANRKFRQTDQHRFWADLYGLIPSN